MKPKLQKQQEAQQRHQEHQALSNSEKLYKHHVRCVLGGGAGARELGRLVGSMSATEEGERRARAVIQMAEAACIMPALFSR